MELIQNDEALASAAHTVEASALIRALVVQETKALTDALIAREAAVEAREQDLRARRARSMRALKLTAGIAMLASTLWVTKNVVAQACVPGSSQNGVLNTLCAQSPARAGDINHNFTTVYNWINNKVGNPSSPNVTVNGTVSATGSVSGSTVSSAGAANVGGDLTVQGRVSFPCSGCGDGGGQWGNMSIQGRVISASSNIHISPPGGQGVYIDSNFRAAGGGGGGVSLNVSGDTNTGGRFHGALGRNSCQWRGAQVSNSTGGVDAGDWYQPNGAWATWGTDHRYHIAACADGEYMAGWSCYATGGLDGNCRIYCCTP